MARDAVCDLRRQARDVDAELEFAMANRRKLTYIAGFVVLCWAMIGAVIGIAIALTHLLKNAQRQYLCSRRLLTLLLSNFSARRRTNGRASEMDGLRIMAKARLRIRMPVRLTMRKLAVGGWR